MPKIVSWLRKNFWEIHPEPKRQLSKTELKKIEELSVRSHAKWTETFSGLSKWIFATLITLSTGGIYLTLTLNVHQSAMNAPLLLFFVAICFALISAFSIVLSISNKFGFIDSIVVASDPTKEDFLEKDIASFYKTNSGSLAAVAFSVFSLGSIFLAGTRLSEAMTVCSQSDLEISKEFGKAVTIRGRYLRSCYFYSIDQLSDDPMERAHQEIELVKHAEKTGFYRKTKSKLPQQ